MPPIRKLEKIDIINTAYNIVKNEGISSISARRVSKELGCSPQPIFSHFDSMKELTEEVYKKIYKVYEDSMKEASLKKDNPYKAMGLAYIYFAKDYPEFFKTIFMQQTNLNAERFIASDSLGNNVIEAGKKVSGFSLEEQRKLHTKVWIFTHGIACLVATKTIKISDEEIDEILESTVREIIIGIKKEKKDE